MQLTKVRKIVLRLELFPHYYLPDGELTIDSAGASMCQFKCVFCNYSGKGPHLECPVAELIELVDARSLRDSTLPTNRYCFTCKQPTKFVYCDNCSRHFCSEHAEWDWDYNEMLDRSYDYPVHKACL